MKALQRFWNWVGNLFGKKVEEIPSLPPAKTPLDEFIEVFSQLSDISYFSPPGWWLNKPMYIVNAIAYFNSLTQDIGGKKIGDGLFTLANNLPVDINAVDDEEESSLEPVPVKLSYEVFGWAEGEAEEHPAMLELAKKRAAKGWIAPLLCPDFKKEEAKLLRTQKATKSKKPAKKKTKKTTKTRKQGKASK